MRSPFSAAFSMRRFFINSDFALIFLAPSASVSFIVFIIKIKEGNENSDAIKALVKVLKSDEIKKFIEDKYDGAVIPFAG